MQNKDYVYRDSDLAKYLDVPRVAVQDLSGELGLEKRRVPRRGGTGRFCSVDDMRKLIRLAMEHKTGHKLKERKAMVMWMQQRLQDTSRVPFVD